MAAVNKNAFMLSSATLMMAPFGTDVFSLTPALHSVGMAREISVGVDSDSVELRNGIQQLLVDSKRSNVKATITASIYEFTAQNMLRSLSLGTGAFASPAVVKRGKLSTAAAAAAVSLSISDDIIPGDATSGISATGDIPSGSTILLQRTGTEVDYVFPTKSTGAASGSGPYTVPIASPYAIPAGMSFPIGSRAWIVPEVPVASVDELDLFGVKITGTLSNFDRPVTVIFPKVKVLKGFNLSFSETDYGSMPWEMDPLLLTASEATGRLADIGTSRAGTVYVGA